MRAGYLDVEVDLREEELTLRMGLTDGHELVDVFETAARRAWDPTELRAIADKIRAVLPADERPIVQIVMVPR